MMPRKPLALALGVLCVAGAERPAWAQVKHERPYFGRTFVWGSGAITTPTAAVPPGKLTLAGTVGADFPEELDGGARVNEVGVVSVGVFGLIEGGFSVYSPDEGALFGKLMLVHGTPEFPAFAVGVLNVTGRDVGRFGNPDPFYNELVERAAVYGVATYTVEPGEDDRPIWLSLSAGYGTGIFSEDNPALDDELRTSGVFGSIILDFKIGRDHFVRVMGEHDAWNFNVGAMLMVGGAELSVGVLALDGENDAILAGREENQIRPYAALTLDASVIKRWPLIFKPRGL